MCDLKSPIAFFNIILRGFCVWNNFIIKITVQESDLYVMIKIKVICFVK